MSRQMWVGAAIAILLIVVVVLGVWLRSGDGGMTHTPEAGSTTGLPSVQGSAMLPAGEVVGSVSANPDVPLAAIPDETLVDGVEALRESRLSGDGRAPAVVRDAASREAPTAAELADPEAYQRYEARQNERLYRSYVKAAEAEVPKLQEQLARGKQGGLTPEQIAEGEEKLRRIEEMRHQLMSDHPELTRPAAP